MPCSRTGNLRGGTPRSLETVEEVGQAYQIDEGTGGGSICFSIKTLIAISSKASGFGCTPIHCEPRNYSLKYSSIGRYAIMRARQTLLSRRAGQQRRFCCQNVFGRACVCLRVFAHVCKYAYACVVFFKILLEGGSILRGCCITRLARQASACRVDQP